MDDDPSDERILPGSDDCEHVWVLEVSKIRTFGGVNIDRVKTCEECGEVRNA